MSEDRLSATLRYLTAGIENAIEAKLTIPAMILFYSALDTAGWLGSTQPYATRQTFIDWIDAYLLRDGSLECTANDLYAARCGLLHTSSPKSKLSDSGRARQVCIAWGNAKVESLQETIRLTGNTQKYVGVHVNQLVSAWRTGIDSFMRTLRADPSQASVVYNKARQFYAQLPDSVVSELHHITGHFRG